MNKSIYSQYFDKLPSELCEYSGGSFLANGLIRLCDPDRYSLLLKDGYAEEDVIAFATTALGDLLVWEKGKYINVVSFSRHKVCVVSSGFEFFFDDLKDNDFLKKYFDYEVYEKLVETLGECDEDECYVMSPIPALTGENLSEDISKGKIFEYNAISIELAGGL